MSNGEDKDRDFVIPFLEFCYLGKIINYRLDGEDMDRDFPKIFLAFSIY